VKNQFVEVLLARPMDNSIEKHRGQTLPALGMDGKQLPAQPTPAK